MGIAPIVFSQTLPATAVGTTSGPFDVSPTGQAIYTIPLWTPPGVGGIEPNLALTYNSQGGSGLIGPGWSLTGFSQISRCLRTYEQDGAAQAVFLSSEDVYCIDGKRLRVTSGAATYGQTGSTYQTEIADFSLVTASQQAAGNGPAWFEVKSKNGLIYEYGNSADSRAILPGTTTPYAWAMSKVRDRQGNNMAITYAQSSGTLAPTSMQYTQTPSTGAPYFYAVVFSYGARDANDRTTGYIAGAPFGVDSQMLRVDVRHGGLSGTLLRTYRLTYADSPTTQRARLSHVQECAGTAGSDCKAATAIAYQDGQVGVQNPTALTGVVTSYAHATVDLNGDARTDLVYAEPSGGNYHYWVRFSIGSGFGPAVNTNIVATPSDSVLVDDFVGSGVPCLLAPVGGTWYQYCWNGATFASSSSQLTVDPNKLIAPNPTDGWFPVFTSADINADGRSDLIWAATSGGVPSVYTRLNSSTNGVLSFSPGMTLAYPIVGNFGGLYGNYTSADRAVRRIDFNGDNRDDVVLGSWTSNQFGINFGRRELISQGATFATGPAFPNPFTPVNWNNDACTDAYLSSNVHVAACNGATGQLVPTSLSRRALVDWDGDGRTDLLGDPQTGGNLQVQLSQGTAAAAPVSTNIPNSHGFLYAVDVDGDGLSDLLSYGFGAYGLHNGSFTPPDLLSSITDGYGNVFAPTFKSITQSNYSASYPGIVAPVYPAALYVQPLYVVDQFTASNGTGGTYQNQFFYWSARKHLQGRGFAGFAAKRTRDSRNNLYRYEELRQDSPFVGLVSLERIVQPNDTTTVASTTNTYGRTVLDNTAYGGRDLVFLNQAIVRSYEVNGPYNGSHVLTRTTTNTYDNWGTLTDQTTTTTEIGTGLNPGAVHTQRTFLPPSTVVNDVTNWCLSRPTEIKEVNSHSLPGGVPITRTTGVAWDYLNCRPIQEVIEPGNAQLQVTTTYGYDGFGNINAVTLTPVAGQGQSARQTLIGWGSDGRAPRTITNPKGHVTQLSWDFDAGTTACPAAATLLGKLHCVTDPNSLTARSDFDPFGRLIREARPDGTATDYSLTSCTTPSCQGSDTNLRTYILEVARDTVNGEIARAYRFFDGFDRETWTQTQVLSGGYSTRRTIFDARGLQSQVSIPYLSGDPVRYTTVTYDVLKRPTLIERQASESDPSTASTQIAYQGLRTVTTDPLNHSNTAVHNALGQVVQMIDGGGSDTDYEYDAFGSLLKTRDFSANEITLTYNVRGMKMSSSDPDMGGWIYDYFPLGELKSQTDAKSQSVTFTYDVLSRPLTRIEPEGTTQWIWDTAATRGIGRLATVTSPGGYGETYSYDNYGRTQTFGTTIDGATYMYTYGYHPTAGLLQTLQYPASIGTPFKVHYDYQYGQLQRVMDYNTGTPYWEAVSTNARAQVIDYVLGNDLLTNRTYDRITGLLDRIDTGFGGGSGKQQLVYTWNKVGSLIEREDLNQGTLNETFEYDALDRLDIVRRNGTITLDMGYDAIGNITSRSDVGSYTYHATKKHAVTAAGSNAYDYDANGNVSSRNGQTINWYSYNLPKKINYAPNVAAEFWYGPDRARYKQVHNATPYLPAFAEPRITHYVGTLFERATALATTGFEVTYRHYIEVNGQRVASHIRYSWDEDEGFDVILESTTYPTYDHLGSMDAQYWMDQYSAMTTPTARFSNDAFGARRDWDWNGPPAAADLEWAWYDFSNRGFTGHEHLDNVGGLIHMNGRVYDPIIGRFMSADPFVQAPYFSQSLNRYSYLFNNPLAGSDPTGFMGPGCSSPDGTDGCGGGSFDWMNAWFFVNVFPFSPLDNLLDLYGNLNLDSIDWSNICTTPSGGNACLINVTLPPIDVPPGVVPPGSTLLPPADTSVAGAGGLGTGMSTADGSPTLEQRCTFGDLMTDVGNAFRETIHDLPNVSLSFEIQSAFGLDSTRQYSQHSFSVGINSLLQVFAQAQGSSTLQGGGDIAAISAGFNGGYASRALETGVGDVSVSAIYGYIGPGVSAGLGRGIGSAEGSLPTSAISRGGRLATGVGLAAGYLTGSAREFTGSSSALFGLINRPGSYSGCGGRF